MEKSYPRYPLISVRMFRPSWITWISPTWK